jgi:hypothetical protein
MVAGFFTGGVAGAPSAGGYLPCSGTGPGPRGGADVWCDLGGVDATALGGAAATGVFFCPFAF